MDRTAELVASAFDLAQPVDRLQRIQAAVHETSRLDTERGSFLVKKLWSGQDPPWRSQYEVAMELERRARRAGIATAVPVMPPEPLFGWATRVDGYGVWRAYEWLEHRKLDATDVGIGWFGETLACLHTLYPLESGFEPEWRWLGVYPRDRWEYWLDAAAETGKRWAAVARSELDRTLAITEYVRHVHQTATDHIVSHLDIGPWNVLHTAHGAVLIDWDGAGTTTASAELGRAVSAFGGEDPVRMRLLISAYLESGGTIACRAEDLFIWQITQRLSGITERIRITLGDIPVDDDPEPAWMNPKTIDADIVEALTGLPAHAAELSHMAARVMPT